MFKKSKLIIKKKDNHLAILKKKKINNKMNNIYKNKQKMKLFFNDLIQNNFHFTI